MGARAVARKQFDHILETLVTSSCPAVTRSLTGRRSQQLLFDSWSGGAGGEASACGISSMSRRQASSVTGEEEWQVICFPSDLSSPEVTSFCVFVMMRRVCFAGIAIRATREQSKSHSSRQRFCSLSLNCSRSLHPFRT